MWGACSVYSGVQSGKVNALENQFHISPFQTLLIIWSGVWMEPSLFLALSPDTISAAVNVKDLYLGAFAVDDDK